MNWRAPLLAAIALISLPSYASAAEKPIKLKFDSTFTALGSGYTLLAVGVDGSAEVVDITTAKTQITPPDSKSRLYVLDPENHVAFQVVAKVCTKAKTGSNKGKFTVCKKKDKVHAVFKAGADLGLVKTRGTNPSVVLASLVHKAYTKAVERTATVSSVNYVPEGLPTLGLASRSAARIRPVRTADVTEDEATDEDADGLVDALDSDDDGDGTIDNYDSDSSAGGEGSSTFSVFSNLKKDIDQSINLHSTGLSTAQIDQVISNTQSLAMQVSGEVSDSVELDCGSLAYCSAGGTGISNGAFPGEPGSTNDPDGDGLGTITRGGTGDIQLITGATSATISAGDTYIQHVTSGGTTTEIPGMLNFVFNSNPAVKTFTVNSDSAQTVNYSSTPILGSRNNCLAAPASGNVSVTVTGWRPQRAGNSAAGEGSWVDIGNSLITADIPNSPCNGTSGCGGNGPGNCNSAAYSVAADPNLSVGANGVEDGKSDQDSDITNTYTLTVDLTTCLNSASGGAISWTSGQTLFVDLQFRSADGDNSAQKFCITRS